MTAIALLWSARERLAVPDAWLHRCADGHVAVTAAGEGCSPEDPRAASWDLYGALRAAGARPGDKASDEAWALVARAAGVLASSHGETLRGVAQWHEAPERTRQHVVAALDVAVKLATGRAS